MAAVADLCLGELTKLRAQMRAKNPLSKKRDASEEAAESTEAPASPKSPATARREKTMSETTVFLLMDRFAPS